jgi:DnaJ-class molecular chaperone
MAKSQFYIRTGAGIVYLTEPCKLCWGSGLSENKIACPTCSGRGQVTTEAGETIKRFMVWTQQAPHGRMQ